MSLSLLVSAACQGFALSLRWGQESSKRKLWVQGTASALAPLQAAAHQPLYGVWNLGGFTHVPLEQAALAFLPAARARSQAREVVGLLLGLALAVGIVTSAVSVDASPQASLLSCLCHCQQAARRKCGENPRKPLEPLECGGPEKCISGEQGRRQRGKGKVSGRDVPIC